MSITPMDARNEIKRLEAAGYTVPKVGADAVAQSWAEEMGSVSRLDLAGAVTAVIHGDSSYWPKIGKLIGMAHDARRARPVDPTRSVPLAEEYRAWESHVHDELGGPLGGFTRGKPNRGCKQCEDGCPVCRARYAWQPRLVIVHDERRHEDAGIGWTGYCRADVEFYRQSDAARENVDRARLEHERERERAAALAQLEREQVARKMGTVVAEAAD